MPHCIIEYAKDINIDADVLMKAVYTGAIRSDLFEEHHIKIRALAYDDYLVGAKRESFIHVSARILSGRSVKQRSSLSNFILSELIKLNLQNVVITVEVIDMDRELYSKKVLK